MVEFVKHFGDCNDVWEKRLKIHCGEKWFKPTIIDVDGVMCVNVPSKKSMTTKDFSEWFQNIVDHGLQMGVVVPMPDKDMRSI
jgi:hypothetical protein